MTVFMRTPSGLRNLAKFHSADITVYIEGRCLPDGHKSGDIITYDELYYQAILSTINDKVSYKIKTVGCKKSVLEYSKNIKENNIKNCFSIIDSDWEGVLTSWLPDSRLIHTYGYSWENEFWTADLIVRTLRELMPSIRDVDEENVKNMVSRAAYRLARVSKIDCITKLHGIKFIPSSKKSAGVDIQPLIYFLAPAEEIRKFNQRVNSIRKEINKCSVSHDVRTAIEHRPAEKVIRGHLWEFSSICILSYFYKLFSGEKSISKYVVKATAHNVFARTVRRFLTPVVVEYYQIAIDEALATST